MSDLPERLRELADSLCLDDEDTDLMREAAAEIERLKLMLATVRGFIFELPEDVFAAFRREHGKQFESVLSWREAWKIAEANAAEIKRLGVALDQYQRELETLRAIRGRANDGE